MRIAARPASVGATLALTLALVACSNGGDAIEVRSSAFDDGDEIPSRYSCEDENVSPPLSWDGVPDDAAELALVVSDPDAPDGTFFHWVVVGIDASERAIAERTVPEGATQAKGSSDNPTYIGMCPPEGENHEYAFTVYALGQAIPADVAAQPAADVVAEVEKKSIAKGSLTGTFGR